MDDTLEQRIDALERAVTDGDHDLSTLTDEADALDRLAAVENRLDELDERVDELDAATQALRGYVGNIRSVNRDVEQRADAALATAESVEQALASQDDSSGIESSAQTAASGTEIPGEQRPASGDAGAAGRTGTAGGAGQFGARSSDRTTAPRTPQSDETATERGAAATPDGGARTSESNHCHACGRRRESHQHVSDVQEDVASGSTGPVEASAEGSQQLVDGTAETSGTLERIREML